MKWQEKGVGFAGQRFTIIPMRIVETAMRHPILKGLLPTHAGYFPVASGHLRARERGAQQDIFIYCIKGSGWCEIAGARHPVTKGHLLVIPSGIPHVYGAELDDPWSIHFFHAVGNNLPSYLKTLGVSESQPVVPLGGDTRLFSLYEEVLEGIERGFTTPHLIYASHALLHLLGLMIWYRHEFWHGEIDAQDRVKRSIEFMKTHLQEPLRVSSLAAMSNLSVTHYTNQFRRVTGYSPMSYFAHLRMQRAVELLQEPAFSIKEIALQVGYLDQFYFSRAFRNTHDVSPSDFRRLHKP